MSSESVHSVPIPQWKMRSLLRDNVVTVIALGFLVCRVSAGASDHKYKDGQAVPLYANKVGPFHNPR